MKSRMGMTTLEMRDRRVLGWARRGGEGRILVAESAIVMGNYYINLQLNTNLLLLVYDSENSANNPTHAGFIF